MLQVTYDCEETTMKKSDLLHIVTSWPQLGERYDCVILQGSSPSGLVFCQVCAVFMISIAQEWCHLAVMRIHKQKERNKTTGYIELIAPKAGCFDL